MQDFKYMRLESGQAIQFVAHAKKYTKREFLELCFSYIKQESQNEFHLREPIFSDIKDAFLKPSVSQRYINNKQFHNNACYELCPRQDIHSFPVWLIDYSELK